MPFTAGWSLRPSPDREIDAFSRANGRQVVSMMRYSALRTVGRGPALLEHLTASVHVDELIVAQHAPRHRSTAVGGARVTADR